MSVYNSYSDKYQRKNNIQSQQQQRKYSNNNRETSPNQNFYTSQAENQMLNTDKDQYIKQLEAQTEKFQQIIYEQNRSDQDLGAVHCKIQDHDEKFENITKLIKLLQQFAESQEEENKGLKQTMKQLFQQKQFALDLFNNQAQTPEMMFELLEKMENQQKDFQNQLEQFQQNQLQLDQQSQNNFNIFQNQVNDTVIQLSKDIASDIQQLDIKFSQEKQEESQQVQESINNKLDDFRQEVNNKINIIMEEVKLSAVQEDVSENSRKIFKLNKSLKEFKEKLESKYPRAMGTLQSPTDLRKKVLSPKQSTNKKRQAKSQTSANLSKSRSPKTSFNQNYFPSPHSRSELHSFNDNKTSKMSKKSSINQNTSQIQNQSQQNNDLNSSKFQKTFKNLESQMENLNNKVDKVINQQKSQKKSLNQLVSVEDFNEFRKNMVKSESKLIYANVVDRFNNFISKSSQKFEGFSQFNSQDFNENENEKQSFEQQQKKQKKVNKSKEQKQQISNQPSFQNQMLEEAMESFGVGNNPQNLVQQNIEDDIIPQPQQEFQQQYSHNISNEEQQEQIQNLPKKKSVLKQKETNKENLKNSNVFFKNSDYKKNEDSGDKYYFNTVRNNNNNKKQSFKNVTDFNQDHLDNFKTKRSLDKKNINRTQSTKRNAQFSEKSPVQQLSKRNSKSKISKKSKIQLNQSSENISHLKNTNATQGITQNLTQLSANSLTGRGRGRKSPSPSPNYNKNQIKMILNSIERSRSKSHRSCDSCRILSQELSQQNLLKSRSKSNNKKSPLSSEKYLNIQTYSKPITPIAQKTKKIIQNENQQQKKNNVSPINNSKKKILQQPIITTKTPKVVNTLLQDKKDKEDKIKQLLKKRRENQEFSNISQKAEKTKKEKNTSYSRSKKNKN